jgi:hypothetical protein
VSILVYHVSHNGLFTAKFGKNINQVNESDSDILVKSYDWVKEIDYSLSANVIIWRVDETYNDLVFCVFYAIPINKR